MRNIFCLIILVSYQFSFSQQNGANDIKTALPEIAPASPSVVALMKFEEVAVSNYTGIPDIAIPLYDISSHSKNVSVNLSLAYHPYSAAADEVASSTGLGWNLLAGGTISRTVMGFPDEHYKSGFQLKMGIYQNESAGVFANTYYQAMESFNGAGTSIIKKFLWDAYEKGRYDTQHDLYQFNFMGRSGRFIIKKNQQGTLEVSKLSNSEAMDISFNYNYNSSTRKYDFLSFTLLDEKGTRYLFDIIEKTTQGTTTQSTFFGTGNTSISNDNYDFISAFHLSKVYDSGNNLVASFGYNDELHPITEAVSDVTSEHNFIVGFDPVYGLLNNCPEQLDRIEPLYFDRKVQRSTKTKKLQSIDVTDVAKVEFVYELGRQDYNLVVNANSSKLKSVVLKTWSGSPIKRFDFSYTYSEISSIYGKRMMLSKIEEGNYIDQKKQAHEFYYAQSSAGSRAVGKDAWGFFNVRPYISSFGYSREVDPYMIKTDVLQKIKLPTGGAKVFDFEANTYSHVGDSPLSDFDENPENWINRESTMVFNSVSGASPAQILEIATVSGTFVKFSPSLISGSSMGVFTIRKILDDGSSSIYSQFNCGNDLSCSTEEIYFPPGAATYTLVYNWFDAVLSSSVRVDINYRTRIDSGRNPQPLKEYLYGGGMRIKNIGYFEDGDVPQNYYDSTLNQYGFTPASEKNYSYGFAGTSNKSSGSLVFGKPVFTYTKVRDHHISCPSFAINMTIAYQTTCQVNNLLSMRTQGSDVGYQNVMVRQTGNGKTQYYYQSPIDEPQGPEAYTQHMPFIASSNLDYRRGFIKKEKIFREDGQLLQETDYEYDIVDAEQVTGLRMFQGATRCAFSYLSFTYEEYLTKRQNCIESGEFSYNCETVCKGDVFSYIGHLENIETYGWVKLREKSTKKIFETEILEEREEYIYEDFNKQLSSQKHFTNGATGDYKKLEYEFYIFPGNRISEISSVTSSDAFQQLSKVQYDYLAQGGKMILSSTALAKGNNLLEQRLKFNLYDMWENLLEAQAASGTKVSYIWGYNGTKPVAKIDNTAYASIPSNLISAIHAASSAVPYDEASLVAALDALRASPALSGAMVTTFTYRPLFGISTVTDPKGYRSSYEYDSFGRLELVKDNDGNILSENKYNYRP